MNKRLLFDHLEVADHIITFADGDVIHSVGLIIQRDLLDTAVRSYILQCHTDGVVYPDLQSGLDAFDEELT